MRIKINDDLRYGLQVTPIEVVKHEAVKSEAVIAKPEKSEAEATDKLVKLKA